MDVIDIDRNRRTHSIKEVVKVLKYTALCMDTYVGALGQTFLKILTIFDQFNCFQRTPNYHAQSLKSVLTRFPTSHSPTHPQETIFFPLSIHQLIHPPTRKQIFVYPSPTHEPLSFHKTPKKVHPPPPPPTTHTHFSIHQPP